MKTSGRPRLEYGYTIVIVAFVMMMIIWGTFNTFGVFFEPLIKQFGWTRAMTSGASALNTMIFGIICVFSAGLSERFGPRWVMTVCGVILGLSYYLMARIASPGELYLYLGVFVAIGMSPYIPLLSLVPRWFPTKRGRMNAIVMSGMGLGTDGDAAAGRLPHLPLAVAQRLSRHRHPHDRRHGSRFPVSQEPSRGGCFSLRSGRSS